MQLLNGASAKGVFCVPTGHLKPTLIGVKSDKGASEHVGAEVDSGFSSNPFKAMNQPVTGQSFSVEVSLDWEVLG